MAQGDVLLNDDGAIALDATGKIRLVDASSDCPDCCGCAAGVDCQHCDDGSPAEYQVTFSGVQLCGCVSYGGGWIDYTLSETINGTFTLTQGVCVWAKTISNMMSATRYDSCGGSITHTSTSDVVITLEPSGAVGSATWELYAQAAGLGLGFAPDLWLFVGEVSQTVTAGDNICLTIPAIDNIPTVSGDCGTLFAGDAGNDYYATYDGSATVVCV
jgi:hypothetical protein